MTEEIQYAICLRIARRVRDLRLSHQMTQEAVAHRAGLALRHFQKVEAGEVNLTIATLVKLAIALDVDTSALLRRDEAECR